MLSSRIAIILSIIIPLLACLAAVGYYISILVEDRASLEHSLLTATAASEGYQKAINILDKEIKSGQAILAERERKREASSKLAIDLQKKLNSMLSKEEKQCYENSMVPTVVIDSIIDRLRPKSKANSSKRDPVLLP